MKTIGFVLSTKENEKRRALLPQDILRIKHKKYLYFEKGYGNEIGLSDAIYQKAGANIATREEILSKDVICDPKIGDANYLERLTNKTTIFGWIHAVHNKEVTNLIIEKKLTAIAWESMNRNGRHVFWRNSELAGKAAVLDAIPHFGKLPSECKVAIIGRGNVSEGAFMILSNLGAKITIYNKRNEKFLRNEISNYDIIVNGILWDPLREDHIIYQQDLKRMKKPSLIIDVSCDEEGAIETSHPTTIENPIYVLDGVMHYAVDHTPSLFPYIASEIISSSVKNYIDDIIENKIKMNKILKPAIIIEMGKILDKQISDYKYKYAI
ncbi:MAG: N(5)-(carboxyethyl)ornithine synthase [Sphaerochaetaceae bacterium]|nr:N(5)-(carboxyethyl)ornithine synthase [Sphaerochaetaceae bacterium]